MIRQAVEKVIHDSSDTRIIRQRMEEARCDLDEDVQEIVEGARDMGEWRSYVRMYPWVCVGAALATGYWIVPRRSFGSVNAQMIAELANQSRLHVPWKDNTRSMLLAFAGDLLMRGVSAYVVRQGGELFATQTANSQQDH